MTDHSKLFERQFDILIKDIRKLVYDNKHAHEKIDEIVKQYTLKHLLPTDYVINNFNIYIRKPYGQQIYDKNADFFMTNEYTLADTEFNEYNNIIVFLTQVFKDLWQNGLEEDIKDKIWTRMQILVKLCEKWEDAKADKTSQ